MLEVSRWNENRNGKGNNVAYISGNEHIVTKINSQCCNVTESSVLIIITRLHNINFYPNVTM